MCVSVYFSMVCFIWVQFSVLTQCFTWTRLDSSKHEISYRCSLICQSYWNIFAFSKCYGRTMYIFGAYFWCIFFMCIFFMCICVFFGVPVYVFLLFIYPVVKMICLCLILEHNNSSLAKWLCLIFIITTSTCKFWLFYKFTIAFIIFIYL